MSRFGEGARKLARTGAYDFGGIIVFYLLMWLVGLKAAIAGTLVFVVVDIWRRRRLRIGFPRLYVLTTAMAIIFGVIDLVAKTPFMLKYEGAVSNLVIGLSFVVGARGRSVFEELVTQQAGAEAIAFPNARRFYQILTMIWAAYYLLMSCLYAWVGLHFPYRRAIAIRQVAGFIGLGLMMLVTFLCFRRIGHVTHGVSPERPRTS